MLSDEDFLASQAALKAKGQLVLTKEERKQRQRALDSLGIPSFRDFVHREHQSLTRKQTEILQLNIGLYCNQACSHCHVESSPKRKEVMDRKTADRCLHVLTGSPSVVTVDITGTLCIRTFLS
jgi:sulfatase maturation enzyme AslB (radical SAM superfamily)